jgi:hypothetical protein
MNYKEIFLDNIESNRDKIIKDIQEIGVKLSQSSEIIKRRELVDLINLKNNFKIKDGLVINLLVNEAYQNSNYSESLRDILVNNIESNNTNNKVYNPERVYIKPTCWNFDENKLITDIDLITKAQENVFKTDGILLINEITEEVEKIKVEEGLSLTGASKVEAYNEYAKKVINGYEKIINTYENVKNKNLDLVSDFEDVRNELKIIREDILNLLIDLYGSLIKSNEPELFNFSNISWVDFEDTWDKLNLFYDNINKNIETFRTFHKVQLDNISISSTTNINKFFKDGNQILKNKGTEKEIRAAAKDIKTAAIQAGVTFLFEAGSSIIKSRSEAKKTVTTIKRDVEKLRIGMREDVEVILNDIIRLGYLQTEIKDKLLPQLKIFISQIYKQIDIGIKPIYEEIISDNNIGNLRSLNIKLTAESRKIQKALIDEKDKMAFSEKYLLDLDEYISSNKFEFEYVKNLYPEEPKGLYKFLSGNKHKVLFNETLNDWNKHCKPKIEEYETVISKRKKEIILQKEITNDMQLLQERKKEIEQSLILNSKKINSLFKDNSTNNELLKKLIVNIKEIVTSSKGVLEVSLKEQLLIN